MVTKSLLSSALLVAGTAFAAHAQTTDAPHRWGLETELVQPFIPEVGIFTVKATRTVAGNPEGPHGDLLVGAYLRPAVKHNIVAQIDEYLLTLGYRQYVWRGLHVEVQSDQGFAWGTRNKIDGKNYDNPAWLVEGNAGYRFGFGAAHRVGFYALPQIGVLHGVSTNIGPRGGNSDTFLQGKLLVGLSF